MNERTLSTTTETDHITHNAEQTTPPEASLPGWFSIKEATRLAGLSPNTICHYMASGKLPARRALDRIFIEARPRTNGKNSILSVPRELRQKRSVSMEIAATVFLDREQMECLPSSMQAYHHFALARLAPTPERNIHLRLIQQFQGKLLAWQPQQRTTLFALVACASEQAMLQRIIKSLLEWYGTQPAAARAEVVTHLGHLYLQVKRHASGGTTANHTTGEKPSPGSIIGV